MKWIEVELSVSKEICALNLLLLFLKKIAHESWNMWALKCGWRAKNGHRNVPGKTVGGRLLGEHGAWEGSTFFSLEKFKYDHVKKAG